MLCYLCYVKSPPRPHWWWWWWNVTVWICYMMCMYQLTTCDIRRLIITANNSVASSCYPFLASVNYCSVLLFGFFKVYLFLQPMCSIRCIKCHMSGASTVYGCMWLHPTRFGESKMKLRNEFLVSWVRHKWLSQTFWADGQGRDSFVDEGAKLDMNMGDRRPCRVWPLASIN